MSWGRDSSPGGLVFAKRKRNIFKGPTLNVASAPNGTASGSGSGNHSRSASVTGRQSKEIIEEENEDEIEEVDTFTPLTAVDTEEHIFTADETQAGSRVD
jgi:hypothetical protein